MLRTPVTNRERVLALIVVTLLTALTYVLASQFGAHGSPAAVPANPSAPIIGAPPCMDLPGTGPYGFGNCGE